MNNFIIQHPLLTPVLTVLAIFVLAVVCTIIDIKYMQPKDSTGSR